MSTTAIVPSPQLYQSLLRAADALASATSRAATDVHTALHQCAAAIEFDLDTLSAELRRPGETVTPRVRPGVERAEAVLQSLMQRCWDAERSIMAGSAPAALPLAQLAKDLREAASSEFDLLYDALNSPGVSD
jgi:hypothetical protein